MRILIWKGKDKKRGGRKNLFLFSFSRLCLQFFFFASLRIFSHLFLSLFFSRHNMKNVLLWGKGLRRRGRTTKGHRDEEEEGNDNDNNNNNNNNKGCVGTRVIATREIRFLFFRRRTVRRRSRYAPSFFLSFSLSCKKQTDAYITKSLLSVKRKTEKTRREKSPN